MKPQDSQRLTFNLIEQSYLDDLFKLHSDPSVMKYIREADKTLADTQKTMDLQLANAKKHHGFGLFCAHEKQTQAFIGWGYIYHLAFDESLPIEVGYRLSPTFWGRGYATEIASSFVEYGHHQLKLPILCAVTDPQHIKSQKVLEKSGFQYIDKRLAYDHLCSYFEHTYS